MPVVSYLKFNVVSQPNPADPNQTVQSTQLGPHGLSFGGIIMELAVGVDKVTAQSLHAQGIIVPPPIKVKGLIDTGCTITSIDYTLATALGLRIRGYNQTHTANGVVIVPQHQISLGFPDANFAERAVQTVQATNLAGQAFHVLIGRDLMASWSMTYNGPAGFVSISE
jgi:hypothetical protein